MIVTSHSTNVTDVRDVNEIDLKALKASKNYMKLGTKTEVGYCASSTTKNWGYLVIYGNVYRIMVCRTF